MNLTPREYQKNIFDSILRKGNTLVVLPTGLGKTLIALMLIKDKISSGRCLFLAPTKPLVLQHFNSITSILDSEKTNVTIVTGDLPPKKRKEEYNKKIIVATPQTINNDLKNKLLSPQFSLIIFDEGHRAVGDYAYVKIAEKVKDNALIVSLTASPGGRKERIEEVLSNLYIKNVELRTTTDIDVKPYTHQTNIFWQFVDLPPTYMLIKRDLESLISKYAKVLAAFGFPPPLKSKTQFMHLRVRILKSSKKTKFIALLNYALLLNLLHMVELLETQSLQVLQQYINRLSEKTTKSSKILLNNPLIKRILLLPSQSHPKLELLTTILSTLKNKKIIVFAQYRDQITLISKHLNKNNFNSRVFMGKKDNFTKKLQEETLSDFREGKFNILCSSSVGEEGLDIPAVDVVIFYEPIPSEIRSIQRRGRTGRFSQGEVYILITRKSRDEYFYWASINREKKMKSILSNISFKKDGYIIVGEKKPLGQTKLSTFK
ncbi:MAG: DEAD/DEAH box helicase family protein [Candidatus ainarchaeum sp.]|nr:DEAD/DEAH box helicase family protein [Candidatus ainarchaeum sp.]